MAYTYCANEFNSTPFSSCCRIASYGSKCEECGNDLLWHEVSPSVARARRLRLEGKCGLCSKPMVDCNC